MDKETKNQELLIEKVASLLGKHCDTCEKDGKEYRNTLVLAANVITIIIKEAEKKIDEINGKLEKLDLKIMEEFKMHDAKKFCELVVMMNKKWNSDLKKNLGELY